MAQKYSITKVADLMRGQLFSSRKDHSSIVEILTDSRKLGNPHKTLFFALTGTADDGHNYIPDLYEKGVRNFVISKPCFEINKYDKSNFILVDNTLKALQLLAAAHRNQFSCPVIGITGSNGKTVVKEWLYQLLSGDFNIVRSPKSYNSQIGVALSIWQMNESHHMAIFEAGISEPGEMDQLQLMIRPDIGIFTNIGHAHDVNFINNVQKAGEKFKLFRNAERIIYSPDYAEISEVFIRSGHHNEIDTFTWSRRGEGKLNVISIEKKHPLTHITARYRDQNIDIEIPFHDEASVENAILCWATMLSLEYQPKVIRRRMKNLPRIEMRLELKEGINNCTIINDSYSLDLDSLKIALDFLLLNTQHKKRTVILSDILQSGVSDRDLYDEVSRLLSEKSVDRLIGVGNAISRFPELFEMETAFFPDTVSFLRDYSFSSFRDEIILVKGARIFGFERINHTLQKKDHETILEVNMEAMIHNLKYYRDQLLPHVKIMAMVKAFSYGSGSVEIASLLQFHHVDYLAVAFTDEGIDLRQNGITLPVLVLNPERESFNALLKYHLEPEIFSFFSYDYLIAAIVETGYATAENPVKIHIKLDTGMHRLGFCPADIPDLIQKLMEHPEIKVGSVFSHLASAGNPKDDDFTLEQISLFDNMASLITEGLDYPVCRHILNSDGIIRFSDYQMDMVRLGISMYGISMIPEVQKSLENVCSFKSIILQIKALKRGESVGYDRAFIAQRDTTVAIVPVGYADGLNRAFSDGIGQLFIRDMSVPIIGKICMDMCMLDVTGIPCAEGDEVVIFDEKHTVRQLAEKIKTIPYEMLSTISRRVKRVYYH
ncbi:MAG: bifunctional UDP-N-acetylmuramoyl-tripeptide:D-alanyl-D-alanine ligase/alanine racemase [Bacteroidales bacterium]|nr:bifunctional UDP-N-acetylmuramoyl-tripeptide:D-alanyl-D-alanine ligase/alanine racemase [Bacteroidales bacterium]MDD3010588.1 bifunctional UDP-N-acetylmuramoyl-tripeptide:D-alanyl-D-alanine ligase/alanine racemase [Bacteroidales bacterium]